MPESRPNPDALLARVQAEESRAHRGKLKIFFGAAPGVGKTYAMLQDGRRLAREGIDVVVGYVEPHVRPETQALVIGLDVLPKRAVEYRGHKFQEFDLAAALARKPAVILVDELAHTNTIAPTSTSVVHAKRWREVEQLREAGIDVYTTLNVQHLESVNDVVAKITGVIQRETVPDSIFDTAEEIELVDLSPEDLIERLQEGKVYVSGAAERALENFFNKGNLIALRELALRRMADRVERQMTDYRESHSIGPTWPAAERLLVCVGPSPTAATLVRATRRMAVGLRAPWIAAHVESSRDVRLSEQDRQQLARTLHLAEQLGAETATLSGEEMADELIAYARSRNVTKLIVGKPLQPAWREWFRGSLVYQLTRKCGDIDVYVMSGQEHIEPRPFVAPAQSAPTDYRGLIAAVVAVCVCTLVGFGLTLAFRDVAPANLSMLFLLGTVVVALRYGRLAAAATAILGVLSFDYFFVPPFKTFAVSDTQYVLTFGVMLATGLIISTLASRVRTQVRLARQREQRTSALYAMSRELLHASSLVEVLETATRHICSVFTGDIFLLLPPAEQKDAPLDCISLAPQPLSQHDRGVAQWVLEHDEKAGWGTDTLPSSATHFLPLVATQGPIGVFGLRPATATPLIPDQQRLLETFVGQVALSVLRIRSTEEAQRARVLVEAERLRNSLLSAVSHDLRTPLAAIAGASSTLVEGEQLDHAVRKELASSIYDESERLNRLVANLLDMTRLEAGALAVHKEWIAVPELIGGVLQRLSRVLRGHQVVVDIPHDLPLAYLDELLVHQVLTNLLENAARYAPMGGVLELRATCARGELAIEVADRGPGLVADDLPRIFDKFYRSASQPHRSGVGLGLAICKGIVELHGGRIEAQNRQGGGASFRFVLPQPAAPPALPQEPAEERAA